MKIYHLQYPTDAEAQQAQPSVDALDGVLKAEAHQAFGNGPAYVVVVTQGDFDTALFQREFVLAYDDNSTKEAPASEVEVEELNTVYPDGTYPVLIKHEDGSVSGHTQQLSEPTTYPAAQDAFDEAQLGDVSEPAED